MGLCISVPHACVCVLGCEKKKIFFFLGGGSMKNQYLALGKIDSIG